MAPFWPPGTQFIRIFHCAYYIFVSSKNLKKVKPLMMLGCSFKHSFETERQFPVILLIAKFWQFSSLRHKVEQVNVSLEKKIFPWVGWFKLKRRRLWPNEGRQCQNLLGFDYWVLARPSWPKLDGFCHLVGVGIAPLTKNWRLRTLIEIPSGAATEVNLGYRNYRNFWKAIDVIVI